MPPPLDPEMRSPAIRQDDRANSQSDKQKDSTEAPLQIQASAADEYDAEELDDLTLSIKLLAGRYDWEDDLPTKRYLTKDEDFVARKAIVRLLLSKKTLDGYLRRQLAALFDPEPEVAPFSSGDSSPMERRLVFAKRSGRMSQNLRKLQIAIAVDELRAAQPEMMREDAIDEIAKRFGFKSSRTVEGALKHRAAVMKSGQRRY